MNWNLILLVTKWVSVVLFYGVLLALLIGVYREMAGAVKKEKPAPQKSLSRLRILAVGDDYRIMPGTILELKEENRLGAEKDNDIILRDSYVSGYHAYLHWDGQSWWLEDLNSRNGTQINRQRIPPRIPKPVTNGAILNMGDMELELIG